MRGYILGFLAACAAAAVAAPAPTMGPLLPNTQALCPPSQGCCADNPGESSATCTDLGEMASAAACAAACDGARSCSAVTWHGPSTGVWAQHCIARLDDVWAPQDCGAGCDHVSARKVAGWAPAVPVWPPAAAGWGGKLKPTWFGANASGLDVDETLALLARHAVAGYGWQQGHAGGGAVGRGEALLAAAATNARDYFARQPAGAARPVLFVYRQIQVALRLFAQSALAADDPANDAFFLHDAAGKLCTAAQPWGTNDPYWNFSQAAATSYWLDNVISELSTESALLGGGGAVFFDEVDQGQCGYRAGSCDFAAFTDVAAQQAASVAMLGSMVKQLNAAGITPILSLDNRLAASGDGLPGLAAPCALPEDALLNVTANAGLLFVRFYENFPQSFWTPGGPDLAAAMIANALLETAAGVPVIMHSGGACPAPARNITRPGRLGGDIEAAVASYLIVADAGTTLSISNDWYDASFCWRPEFDVDFGAPLGPATRLAPHAWTRAFARANVSVDVSAGGSGSSVYLLA